MSSRFVLSAIAACALCAGTLPAFAQGRVYDRNASNNPEIYQQTHPEDRSNPQLQGQPRAVDRPAANQQPRPEARRDNDRRQPDRRNWDQRGQDRRGYGYVVPRPAYTYNYGYAPPVYYSAPPVYYSAPPVYYGGVPQPFYPSAAPVAIQPGDYLPPEYLGPQFAVADWQWRGLAAPPIGYHWVLVGSDSFALVADNTGQILSLVAAR